MRNKKEASLVEAEEHGARVPARDQQRTQGSGWLVRRWRTEQVPESGGGAGHAAGLRLWMYCCMEGTRMEN